MKKGSYFFILDAFIGGTIVFFTLILLTNTRVVEPIIHTTSFTSNDYLQILSSTKIRDFNNNYLNELRLAGDISDSRITLLELIINLEEEGKDINATELVGNFTPGIIPAQTGIELVIADPSGNKIKIYSLRNNTLINAQSVSVSRTIIIDSINYKTHIVEVKTWI